MLSSLAFAVAVLISVGCVAVSVREFLVARRRSQALFTNVEAWTKDGEQTGPRPDSVDEDVAGLLEEEAGLREEAGLLEEAMQDKNEALALLAAAEIVNVARLGRTRILSLQRGLARIPLLSGAGGAFSVLAFSGFSRTPVTLAVVSVFTGAISATLAASFLTRARGASRREGEVADSLFRELEKYWKSKQGNPSEGS